jgi:hypothetical protein
MSDVNMKVASGVQTRDLPVGHIGAAQVDHHARACA